MNRITAALLVVSIACVYSSELPGLANFDAHRAYEDLDELAHLHSTAETLAGVEHLVDGAHLDRFAALEHFDNPALRKLDLQHRTQDFAHEETLKFQASSRVSPKVAAHDHEELAKLHKEMMTTSHSLSHDESETLADRQELAHAVEQHEAMLRVILLRRRQLERVRDMKLKFQERDVSPPPRLLAMEHLEVERVSAAERAASELAGRVARLQLAVQDAPKRIQAEYEHRERLARAARDVSDALKGLHQADIPYFDAVREDAKEIESKLQPDIAFAAKEGKDGVRGRVATLLEAADKEKDFEKKQALLKQARDVLDIGRVVYHHLGEISTNTNGGAAAATSKGVKAGAVADDEMSLLHSDEDDLAALLNGEEDRKGVASTAAAPGAPATTTTTTTTPAVQIAAKQQPDTQTSLETCVSHADELSAKAKAEKKVRERKLLSIGFCLDKLDRLQRSLKRARRLADQEEEAKEERDKKNKKKSNKKKGKGSNNNEKKNGGKREDLAETLLEEDEIAELDDENNDYVLATALELLQIEPEEAEVQGPDYIQRQLVEMGMTLRKEAQEEEEDIRSAYLACQQYCASAAIHRVADIEKRKTHLVSLSHKSTTLSSRLSRASGEISEARKFFESERKAIKGRIVSLKEGLLVLKHLVDHVDKLENSVKGGEAVEDSDDSDLMASLQEMATRRPLAQQLLQEMTSENPDLPAVRIMLGQIRDAMLKEEKDSIKSLSEKAADLKRQTENVQALRAVHDAAARDNKNAESALEEAKSKASFVKDKCDLVRSYVRKDE